MRRILSTRNTSDARWMMTETNSHITEYQRSMINFLIRTGYGWGRYARNVLNSGECTEKQHETLLNMVGRIQYKSENKCRGESDIDWDDKGDFYE